MYTVGILGGRMKPRVISAPDRDELSRLAIDAIDTIGTHRIVRKRCRVETARHDRPPELGLLFQPTTRPPSLQRFQN